MLPDRDASGTVDCYEPEEHDNDRTFCTPRAWHRLKNALGPTNFHFRDLCLALEIVSPGLGWPRMLIAVALFDFLDKSRPHQRATTRRYHAWCDAGCPLAVEVPGPARDKAASDAEILALIRQIAEGGGGRA